MRAVRSSTRPAPERVRAEKPRVRGLENPPARGVAMRDAATSRAAPDPRFEKDPELIRACLAGDSRAWDRLLSRYERLIFSIPRASGLDTDEAADVYQEVCLALHRGLSKLKSNRAIRSEERRVGKECRL